MTLQLFTPPDDAIQTVTPVWKTTGVAQPAIGNGTLTGKAGFIMRRTAIWCSLRMVAGSTTTFGDPGTFSFELPAPFDKVATVSGYVGIGHTNDAAVADRFGYMHVTSGILRILLQIEQAGAYQAVSNTYPMTFGNGDSFDVTGIIPIA